MKELNEEISFDTNFGEKKNNSIIKVIGVGGAGNNAVQHMYSDGIIGVDFMICNTDRQALERNMVPYKLVLGDTGLGAGADPVRARELAMKSKDDIRELIGEETKMLFITAGMGKGTGTGAAPVVAQIAREMNLLTIGVVTYPYDFEQPKCRDKADKGIEEMKKYVDSLIIIQNQKIIDEYENETFRIALGYADDVLKNAVKCIAELITVEGCQNVDFNDVQTIMRSSGEAMLGIAEASGENRIEEVVSHAMTSPLIDDANIGEANNFLYFIRYGKDAELTVSELKKLNQEFAAYKNADTTVIWGHAVDETLGDKIKLSVIITNYGQNQRSGFEKRKDDTTPISIPTPIHKFENETTSPKVTIPDTPIQDEILPSQNDEYIIVPESVAPQEPAQPSMKQEPVENPKVELTPIALPTEEFVISSNDNDSIYSDDVAFRAHVQTPAYRRVDDNTMADSLNKNRFLNTKTESEKLPKPEYSVKDLLFGQSMVAD